MPVERSGRPWRRLKARVLAGSTICYLCGADGADTADHVIPLARGGTNDLSNLRPAHHDVFPYCNRRKGDRDHVPVVKRSGSLARPQGEAPQGHPARTLPA